MKRMLFFPKIAWTGIRQNRRLYLPYLLSRIGMVAMFYILHSLSVSPLLLETRGGADIMMILSLGQYVIAAFALLFLFYTNSFLIRRRYKEFGLYNVLGMDKRGIGRVILWESLTVAAADIVIGLFVGIVLSKFAELGLLNAIRSEVNYRFSVPIASVGRTAGIFAIIFVLLLLRSLWQVRRSRPLELLRSESTGEKPPKANWFLALPGVILLGVAYFLAVSIQSPLTAILLFFAAVLMVIVATYLLFMSGSVALCRLLQKHKGYYYRKNHFVSVSSMAYRMKRNGAGLASICILCTMVLVMISSTASLYFGANDALASRFQRDNEIELRLTDADRMADDSIVPMRAEYEAVFSEYGVRPENVYEYRYAAIAGMLSGAVVDLDPDAGNDLFRYDDLRMIYFVSAADYNRAMGTDISLRSGQAMVYPVRCRYKESTLTLGGVHLDIVGTLDAFFEIGQTGTVVTPSLLLVIPDYGELRPLAGLTDFSGDRMLTFSWYYGYDLDADDDTQKQILEALGRRLSIRNDTVDEERRYTYYCACLAAEKDDFFTTFGGLFFLGIVLSLVFLFAAVMIIYYKQISEGYEDRRRFAIMRKVGMTKEDIRRSINSQVLTVFFAPLVMAGLHLVFAFPLVWKMLQLFSLHNLTLVIAVTVGAFAVFGLFYAVIYKRTARAYYAIVSADEAE